MICHISLNIVPLSLCLSVLFRFNRNILFIQFRSARCASKDKILLYFVTQAGKTYVPSIPSLQSAVQLVRTCTYKMYTHFISHDIQRKMLVHQCLQLASLLYMRTHIPTLRHAASLVDVILAHTSSQMYTYTYA